MIAIDTSPLAVCATGDVPVKAEGACEVGFSVGVWFFQGGVRSLHGGAGANSSVVVGEASPVGQPLRSTVAKSVRLCCGSDEDVNMLRQEVRLLRELGDSHPHIMPMLYAVESSDELTLLAPYAPQGDLQNYTTGWACMEEFAVRHLTMQLLSALSFLQDQAVVHCDVKPQNILLTAAGGALSAQLADFGLALRLPAGKEIAQLDEPRGSFGFMPAELLREGKASCAADLFALGVTIFRLLCAHDPFYPASRVESAVEYDPACWAPVSAQARDFATRLLSPAACKRGVAAQLLSEDPWLQADWADTGSGVRGPCAPQAMPKVAFHTRADAKAMWIQQRTGPGNTLVDVPMEE